MKPGVVQTQLGGELAGLLLNPAGEALRFAAGPHQGRPLRAALAAHRQHGPVVLGAVGDDAGEGFELDQVEAAPA